MRLIKSSRTLTLGWFPTSRGSWSAIRHLPSSCSRVRGMGNGSSTELPGDIDVQTHSSDRGCLYSLNRAWLWCRSLRIGHWDMIDFELDHCGPDPRTLPSGTV